MNKYIENNTRYVAVAGGFNDETKTISMSMTKLGESHNTQYLGLFPKNLNEKYLQSKHIAGEIYATMSAINQAIKESIPNIVIIYNYVGVERWATKEWRAESPIAKRYTEYLKQAQKYIDIQYVKLDKEDELFTTIQNSINQFSKDNMNETNTWKISEKEMPVEKEVTTV